MEGRKTDRGKLEMIEELDHPKGLDPSLSFLLVNTPEILGPEHILDILKRILAIGLVSGAVSSVEPSAALGPTIVIGVAFHIWRKRAVVPPRGAFITAGHAVGRTRLVFR